MNQYTVWVTETTQWEVEVEAPDIGSAMRLAEDEVNQVQHQRKVVARRNRGRRCTPRQRS